MNNNNTADGEPQVHQQHPHNLNATINFNDFTSNTTVSIQNVEPQPVVELPQQHNNNNIICRICLNSYFESDVSKLDRSIIHIASGGTNGIGDGGTMGSGGNRITDQILGRCISPCKCSGSVGMMHLGCLLLECQYRKSSTCQLCNVKYHHVEVIRRRSNDLLAYIQANRLRTFATFIYFISLPLLTTLWFCNKLRFASMKDNNNGNGGSSRMLTWNETYRALVSKYTNAIGSDRSNSNQNNNEEMSSSTSSSNIINTRQSSTTTITTTSSAASTATTNTITTMANRLHPLLVLIYWYHCDVIWINLVNLFFIQMIISNIEHYQAWRNENRPRMIIYLRNDNGS